MNTEKCRKDWSWLVCIRCKSIPRVSGGETRQKGLECLIGLQSTKVSLMSTKHSSCQPEKSASKLKFIKDILIKPRYQSAPTSDLVVHGTKVTTFKDGVISLRATLDSRSKREGASLLANGIRTRSLGQITPLCSIWPAAMRTERKMKSTRRVANSNSAKGSDVKCLNPLDLWLWLR